MDASAYAALPRVVLDNGSGFIKIGHASSKKPPYVIPNCVGQIKKKFGLQYYNDTLSSTSTEQPSNPTTHANDSQYVSEGCYTLMEYFCMRPHTNSLLFDSNRQRAIWDKLIGRVNPTNVGNVLSYSNVLGIAPESTAISITEPNLCPVQARQAAAEVLFEDFGFPLVAFLSSQSANAHYYDSAITRQFTSKSTQNELVLKSYPDPVPKYKAADDTSCCLVIDCGFGTTHSVPFVNGQPIQNAALRTSLAGSSLNAYLKNITALRFINLEFNELVVQHMKEESCYVSRNFDLELRAAKNLQRIHGNSLLRHRYFLPNYNTRSKTVMTRHFTTYREAPKPLLGEDNEDKVQQLASGKIESLDDLMPSSDEPHFETSQDSLLEHESILNPDIMENNNQHIDLFAERFSVPEILFSPQDINIKACGIVELAYRTIALSPPQIQPLLANNIFLCGGSTKFSGFTERFYTDIRKLLPTEWDVSVYSSEDAALSTFYGAKLWTNDDTLFLSNAITRSIYLENGGSIINTNDMIKDKE